MIPAPRNALVSYHYFKKYDLNKLDNLRLIGDSGAFSAASQGATITTAELAEWGHKWKHRLAWLASLDVIGNPEATKHNWLDMRRNYDLDAVPTLHFGGDPKVMDYYADQGVDFMGLGGMVGHKSSKAKVMRWLVQIFKYQQANHPGMRFHGWGVTANELLRVPFFSVDSSGWGSGYRYGRMTLRDPRTNKPLVIAMNGKEAYEPLKARLLSRHYGVAPSEVATSGGHNRKLIVQLSALSASVQEQHFRRMHGTVSAPKWGINVQPDGPHMHLVDGSSEHLRVLNDMAGPHIHLADSAPASLTGINDMIAGEAGKQVLR